MPLAVYITIDTEEDQWGEYYSSGYSVENVYIIPELQELFDRYGAIPTYLIDYPVIIDKKAQKIIQKIYKDGRCGIGSHCHPWNTPPFKEEISTNNSMLCNLPYDLVLEKIQTLNKALEEHWGFTPTCFRAGRWGLNETVARCIYESGYKVDTSVTPFYSWKEYGGPDFSDAPIDCYKFNPNAILTKDPNGLMLEVPVTIGFYQKNYKFWASIRERIMKSRLSRYHMIGILDRLRILNLRWLSPEMCSGKEMVLLAKAAMRNGYQFLNMSFHSTSLLPGRSPFVRTKSDIKRFLNDIETFLMFAHDNRLVFSSLNKLSEV